MAHHGLIKLLMEDALHTYTIPIAWETFRNMSREDNIRTLAAKPKKTKEKIAKTKKGRKTKVGKKKAKRTQKKTTTAKAGTQKDKGETHPEISVMQT